MKKITLGGYSGRENRGCEAIARSTADLFHKENIEVAIAFRNENEGHENDTSKYFDNFILYKPQLKGIFIYLKALWNKVFGNVYPFEYYSQKKLIMEAKGNTMVHIGGDTYCYSTPYENDALVYYCNKKNIPIVLWAASIEESAILNRKIRNILNRYNKIYIRERKTYELMIKHGFKEKKLFLTADPAFTLKPEAVSLEDDWWSNGVIGINLSPISMQENMDCMLAVNGCSSVIEDILANTKKNVLLVPHVYKNDFLERDYEPLNLLKNRFNNNNRVQLLKYDYSCNQLKYIISKLDIFIAARTHASIASYSSFVPTLVLGYSIKAKGIAEDLFGTYQGYVLPIQELKCPDEVYDAYKWIEEHQYEIRVQLETIIPTMQRRAMNAVEDLLVKSDIYE